MVFCLFLVTSIFFPIRNYEQRLALSLHFFPAELDHLFCFSLILFLMKMLFLAEPWWVACAFIANAMHAAMPAAKRASGKNTKAGWLAGSLAGCKLRLGTVKPPPRFFLPREKLVHAKPCDAKDAEPVPKKKPGWLQNSGLGVWSPSPFFFPEKKKLKCWLKNGFFFFGSLCFAFLFGS